MKSSWSSSRCMALGGTIALMSWWGCSTWTALHGGYGLTTNSERSVFGLEARRALGAGLHSPHALIGARVDGNTDQLDAEAHVGAMRPLQLSQKLTLVPSATLELGRVSNIDGQWYGGAAGPGIAGELLWWLRSTEYRVVTPNPFGCFGGVPAVDCASSCRSQLLSRAGIGLRVAAEYDVRFGRHHPRMNDWVVWFTLGVTRAQSVDTSCP